MDLNEFWQENKRFVLAVVGGVVVFFIALKVIDGKFHQRAAQRQAAIRRVQGDLAQPLFDTQDLARAREQAGALETALVELMPQVEFRPRARFALDDVGGSINARYFAVGSSVSEELRQLAGRSNMRLPDNLGLPPAVVDEGEIARYLECLDVVDDVVRLAADVGVERIGEVRMRLDPRLLAGRPLGTLERNAVEIELSGAAGPLVRLLALSQQTRLDASANESGAQAGRLPGLVVGEVEMVSARSEGGEARLVVTFLVMHLHWVEVAQEVGA